MPMLSPEADALTRGAWPSGYFHWQKGWFFARKPDGSVHMVKVWEGMAMEETIPPNEWQSIIAHVCAKGETGQSYAEAERFHAGRFGEA